MQILERMREGRKSPQVLNIKLLAVRSSRPNSIVFIFESHDDISVYGDWIRRTAHSPEYEAVAGNGKEQLLAFHLMLEQDGRLRGVYFFVDHDYDENPPLAHVFVVPAYSFENLLCVREVIDSVLIDEFRCAGDPSTRARLLAVYATIVEQFERHSRPLHEALFIARREGFRVNSRPDSVTEFLDIALTGVAPKFSRLEEVIEVSVDLPAEKLDALKASFLELKSTHSIRGKYLLQATREWLRLVTADRRSASPSLFPKLTSKLPGSPEQVTVRRLASAAAIPAGLPEFLSAVAA